MKTNQKLSPWDVYRLLRNFGDIYILKLGALYKIGRSKYVDLRLSKLRLEVDKDIELICSYEVMNYIEVEQDLHREFSDLRVRGEWFRLSEKDLTRIQQTLLQHQQKSREIEKLVNEATSL